MRETTDTYIFASHSELSAKENFSFHDDNKNLSTNLLLKRYSSAVDNI